MMTIPFQKGAVMWRGLQPKAVATCQRCAISRSWSADGVDQFPDCQHLMVGIAVVFGCSGAVVSG
jgi:hypothetical protein